MATTDTTKEKKLSWREEQRVKAQWRGYPNAKPGERVVFSPHRGGVASTAGGENPSVRQQKRRNQCVPRAYVISPSGSYHRIDKIIRKQLEAMDPAQRQEFLSKLKQAKPAEHIKVEPKKPTLAQRVKGLFVRPDKKDEVAS